MREQYTPGQTDDAVRFMSRRTLESHGGFFLPYLTDGMSVLDCGCGPGSITRDIGERIPRGSVVGMDTDESQIRIANELASARGLENVEFRQASAYDLPLPTESVGAVFAHALLEHLIEPEQAIGEFNRVLKKGVVLAVSSPDWGGFLIAPQSEGLDAAIDAYKSLQTRNGGDVYAGRKFSSLFEAAGLENITMRARYEVYESVKLISEYLAVQLEDAGEAKHARALREWATQPNGMFAQAWVSCTGRKATTG